MSNASLADNATFQAHCDSRSLAAVTKLYTDPPEDEEFSQIEAEAQAQQDNPGYDLIVADIWTDAVPCNPAHFRDHMTPYEVAIQVQKINSIAQKAQDDIAPLAAELKHNKNWKQGVDSDGNAFSSWEAFCKAKFRLSRVETDRKIDVYIGASKLPPKLLPAFKAESQLRAFAEMPDDEAAQVARAVLEDAKAKPGPYSLGITVAKIENKQKELFPKAVSVLRDTEAVTKATDEKLVLSQSLEESETRGQSGTITTPQDLEADASREIDMFGMVAGESLRESLTRLSGWAEQAVQKQTNYVPALQLIAGAVGYLLAHSDTLN